MYESVHFNGLDFSVSLIDVTWPRTGRKGKSLRNGNERTLRPQASMITSSLNKDRSAYLIDSVLKHDIDSLINNGYSEEALDSVMFKVEVVKEFDIPVRFSQLQDRFYLFYKKIAKTDYKKWIAEGRIEGALLNELTLVNKLALLLGYSTSKTEL